MADDLEKALGQLLLHSFMGKVEVPAGLQQAISRRRVTGVELFRHKNVGRPAEVRALTDALQRMASEAGAPPLLIAANQEGGQLIGIGDSTPFPGNMALGATRSPELAERVGHAMGCELAAVGININFAPVVDVNNNPRNPVIGTRSFGDDPRLVARLGAAMIKGTQAAGVAATAKHFPGHGDTAADSHLALPIVPHSLRRLQRIELPPFRAAVKAGARLIMTAHVALPKLHGSSDLPATLSPLVLRDLLRRKLRYRGVIATDAMDMRALEQGPGAAVEAIAALAAGADLILLHREVERIEEVFELMLLAVRRGLVPPVEIRRSARRIQALKHWLARRRTRPSLEIIGSREHQALAREVAARSVTLVRDRQRLLPLRLTSEATVAVVVPRPANLTVSDTSSYVTPALAAAVRRHHARVDELSLDMNPGPSEVQALLGRLQVYDLVIAGTISASTQPGQASLVNALVERGRPAVVIAMRLPYDLAAVPAAPTCACTYSILPPSMEAVADALFGRAPFLGRLPVRIPKSLRASDQKSRPGASGA